MISIQKQFKQLVLLGLVSAPFSAGVAADKTDPSALRPPTGTELEVAVAKGVGSSMGKRAGSKVSTDLRKLAEEFAAHTNKARSAANFQPTNSAARVHNGLVLVEAAGEGPINDLRASLQGLGLTNTQSYGRMVSGYLPLQAVDQLDNVAGLRLIRPVSVITRSGLTTNQGVEATLTDIVRSNLGLDGSGVTIGTLSDSYDCQNDEATDVSTYDLPPNVNVLREGPCQGNIDEGRAMMQIIHDMAPGASQAFHTAWEGAAAFANGILALANDAGAEIIVDDIGYLNQPFFQDGVIAQAVDQVAAQGVTYFSSAGNSDTSSYESAFNASGVSGFYGELHDFDEGPDVDVTQSITLGVGQTMNLTFQWSSPFFSVSGGAGTQNDLDIFLLDSTGQTIVTASTSDNVGGDALERLFYTNDGTYGTEFLISIELYSGAAPDLMKYIEFGRSTPTEHVTNSSTVFGHPNANGALAIGAVAYFDTPEFGTNPPVLESFSSWGNTPILFDTSGNSAPESRAKPDLSCVDGGNTTFFGQDIEPDGFPNFFGTSASAPLAAAIAGLMLEGDPELTSAQIYAALTSTAIDMGDVGPDRSSGYGLCQSNLAVPAAVDPDNDSLPNITDPDDDNDLLADNDEALAGTNRINPDSDGDSVIDGLDREPLDGSNVLASCESPDAVFDIVVSEQRTCAASNSISATNPAAVSSTGNLLLIAPTVAVTDAFSVEAGGQLSVITRDPISAGNESNALGNFSPMSYTGMSLAWSDEFSGNDLNDQLWNHDVGGWGWGNNESQYYRPENTSVQWGHLIITAKEEAFGGNQYTSSRIKTEGNKDFTYGRVDIRAALPRGQGIWPALWSLGTNFSTVNWPYSGEIDIMEIVGGQGREAEVHGTVHWNQGGLGAGSDHRYSGGSLTKTSGDYADDFNVFSIIRTPDRIRWLVNDQEYYSFVIDDSSSLAPFRNPFFLIFNIAVGGNWPGYPDATTEFPQRMLVDYVRVFEFDNVPTSEPSDTLTVLDNGQVGSTWGNGIGAWDQAISYNTCNNDYGAGCPTVNWSWVAGGDRGQVLQAAWANNGQRAGVFFQTLSPANLSRFSGGTVEFDIRAVNNTAPVVIKVDCEFPCGSGDYQFTESITETWQQLSVPVDWLVNSGLDLTNVSTGLVFWPADGHSGVTLEIDNIVWREATDN